MNNLGLTLAWIGVQIAIVLVPALGLHAMASRRGPAAGAQIAILSLGLVVFLNVAAFVPRIAWNEQEPATAIAPTAMAFENNTAPKVLPGSARVDVILRPITRDGALNWLGLAWDSLGRGAAEPAVRVQPWASTLAVLALSGTAIGLCRLTIGLGAVALCCRRGRRVDDPGITGLLEELHCEMGCRQPVALREVADLTTPATAGRRRPVLLLPVDWRSWSAAERRAVLAHELAHIVRGDYTMGLLARFAVVLNYYHPFVRFIAGRLQLQQEQAADALGAQFAGGRARYLVALSSLALKQDGRSPRWPARAFLPARGTLIRRIAMLRQETNSMLFDRPLPRALWMLTVFALVGLTIGVTTLRGPARGDEDGASPAAKAEVALSQPHDPSKSVVVPYVREGWDGVAVIRPAAVFRHKGMDRLLPLLQQELMGIDWDLAALAKHLKVDTSRPDFLKLRCQDIEYITAGIGFDKSPRNVQGDKVRAQGGGIEEPMHRIMFGTMSARTVAPFDWLAFLRQWRIECEEVRVNGRAYHRLNGYFKTLLGRNPCAFVADDRTIVFDEEDVIRSIAAGEDVAPPAYVRGKEWERASRGLVAIAISNRHDTFAKHYDLGRPDDAAVLSLFKGLDTWILGVADADPIVVQADATCRDREASEAISRSLESLIKMGRQYIEQDVPTDAGADASIVRMLKALAANVRVEHTGNSVTVQAQNFGSLADFATIVEGQAQEAKARVAAGKDAKNSVKQ